MLLYGIPKVIIHIDFYKSGGPGFDWLDLKQILNKYSLRLEQFVDACMIAGTEYCLTYPFLNKQVEMGSRGLGGSVSYCYVVSAILG